MSVEGVWLPHKWQSEQSWHYSCPLIANCLEAIGPGKPKTTESWNWMKIFQCRQTKDSLQENKYVTVTYLLVKENFPVVFLYPLGPSILLPLFQKSLQGPFNVWVCITASIWVRCSMKSSWDSYTRLLSTSRRISLIVSETAAWQWEGLIGLGTMSVGKS